MITKALRSLWAEPRAADAPERVSRDWVLVGVLMVTALLEGVLRDDVAWRPFATIVAVGLAPVLLWRRTRPLACVVVAFGTAMVLGLASLAGGVPSVGLNTMIYLLVPVYALVRWGSGREIVIGLAVVLVAAVIGTVADYVDDRDRVTAREGRQVGDAKLGGVLRSRSVAQHPDHRPHLRQRPRRFPFDDRQRLERRLRSLPGQRSAGLRPHCDRRDVVGDRVVQLARETDPLLAADLV